MAERKKAVNNKTAVKGTEEKKAENATAKTKKSNDKQTPQNLREEAVRKTENRRHIISVFLFAAGLFFTLTAVIPGSEGWRAVFDALHGIFGYAAYLLGPLMIYSAVLISSNKTKNAAMVCLKSVMYILIICGAIQILFVGNTNGKNAAEVLVNLYNGGKEFRGGGAASVIIAGPLLLLGRLGAGIIIVIIALACFLLTSGITVTELLKKVEAPVKKAKDITVEKHRQIKNETAMADEELERMERERLQKEIDTEQADKKDVERLKRVVYSVESGTGKTVKSAEKKKSPIKKTKDGDDPLPEIMASQEEDNAGYMKEIRDYIMDRNRDVLKAAEEKEREENGEDLNGELVPIIDAIHQFKEDNPELPPVREIVDAPAEDITTSDESELPFDLDDVVPEFPEVPKPGNIVKEPVKAPEKPKAPEIQEQKPEKEKKEPEKQITLKDVYTLPPVTLLNPVERNASQEDIDFEIDKNSNTLVETLKSFGVQTKMVGVSRGPSVTRYELQPAPGVKISKITGLVDDISLSLASAGVRIEAPIPNKAAVGIEVPNKQKETVYFRELVDTQEFKNSFDKKLVTVLGKDIGGNMVTCNIAKMPHLLIAGTTGSGKSVCVNSIIMSILMKSTPDEVRLIMVDPKKVEFMMYNGIPHLLIPVVTDPKKAAGALAWAVTEMLNRYKMFSENNVRDFGGYNELANNPDYGLEKMSHIVIFIDELADLMLASPKDVEDSIVRLAQMARAAGMHLVIATQRPTVNVVTGLIKANIPSRIALMVASQMDSRVILDSGGAEKLLGNGDMLYMPVGMPKPMRVQGCFVSDKEVERTVDFIKQTFTAQYDESIMEEVERQTEMMNSQDNKNKQQDDGGDIDLSDDKLEEAIEYVVEAGQASTSALQRRLKLGYGRAARLIDIMEKMGVVGSFEGSKPRQVLMTKQEWYEKKLRQ